MIVITCYNYIVIGVHKPAYLQMGCPATIVTLQKDRKMKTESKIVMIYCYFLFGDNYNPNGNRMRIVDGDLKR